MRGCNEVTKGIVLDSEVVDMQNEDDGIGVEGINGNVNFGSVNDDMIRMCYGTSKDIRSKEEGIKVGRKSFVEAIVQNLLECDKTLESIPTEIDENEVEVVMFDDVMVAEGSKRWDLTLCGFFVGYRMPVNELRKPLVVQKGSVDLNLDNTELERIPLWVKLCNVPLEAWIVKGISALASRLGKPLVMDSVTANKCKQGIGMVRKSVKVEYDWKPQMCSECGVFGHTYSRFYKNRDKSGGQMDDNDEGFVEVKRKKNIGIDNKVKRHNFRANPKVSKVGNNSKTVYQAKTKEAMSPSKTPNKTPEKKVGNNDKEKIGSQGNSNKKWSVHKDILEAMKRSANKPTDVDMKRWSIDMITYYKKKREELVDKRKKDNTEVWKNEYWVNADMLSICLMDFKIGTWNIRGLSTSDKQDAIVKLIQEEKLQICVVLETHLKNKRIDGNMRLYGTFIYASNSGLERGDLWRDLEIYKRIVREEPWFLSGDFNVTLTPKEYSIGSSTMSSDMKDFQRCVNTIKVEDINSSGLFYTWTKNLHKTKNGGQTGILKKLDKIMGNEDFSNKFCQSYAMFLPYIISDHCPFILVIPNEMEDGCMMFKTVKNLKGLKKHLKQLSWCNGDVFENVKKLRESYEICPKED
ncbi:RNA-directed DNA polymerase, eukaryota, reverse transcriptase zinc-binding domain protein [Tanacetum coccineum]